MRHIQVILNTILSKNIFEYILLDDKLEVLSSSEGVTKYLERKPSLGDDILEYMPEFVGSEDEIKKIFSDKHHIHTLDAVYKNNYYVNISIEHCDEESVIVLLYNITDMVLSTQRLQQYNNESTLLNNTLQKVIDNQNALIFVSDSHNIKFANKKFINFFGATSLEEIQDKDIKLFENYNQDMRNYDELFDKIKENEEYIEIDNDTFIIKATLVESIYKLFTLTKVTALSNQKNIDALTGAYRKNYFDIKFQKVLEEKRSVTLVVMDIDDFKKVNDNFGHQVGDNVLKVFSMIVKSEIRKHDLFARWGGEEFVLLLEDSTREDVMSKIEKIRTEIEAYDFDVVGKITSSFGITTFKHGDDTTSLFQRADKALYRAKKNGKNRLEYN